MIDDDSKNRLAAIAEQHGFASVWLVYEAPDVLAPHPYAGASVLVYQIRENRSETPEPETVDIPGDRWLDLWAAADEAIRRSGDALPAVIEDFEWYDPEDGPGELAVICTPAQPDYETDEQCYEREKRDDDIRTIDEFLGFIGFLIADREEGPQAGAHEMLRFWCEDEYRVVAAAMHRLAATVSP